jgi:TetR/AcrR family transcriptional regulator, regulator of autoinduction and epiphytic fitness
MASTDIPNRRERKRVQMLEHLASTAFGLFESQGYEAVTMEQIAAAADVAKGTLYNHFPVKEALLAHWVHMELAMDLKHLLTDVAKHSSFVPRISLLLNASADWCERHRAYLPHYLRFRFQSMEAAPSDQDDDAAPSDLTGAFEALIAESQRAGELRMDLTAPHLAALLHHLYFGALMRWLKVPGLALREELTVAVRLFIEGAARRSAPISKSGKKS